MADDYGSFTPVQQQQSASVNPYAAFTPAHPSAPASPPIQRTLDPTQVDWSDPLGMNSPPPAPRPDPNPDLTPEQKLEHGISDPNHPNMWNAVYGIGGAYKQAVTNGLFEEPARAAMENIPGVAQAVLGYDPMDKLKGMYPGKSDDWYRQTLHGYYNDAVTSSRQQAYEQTAANPYPGHIVGNTLAGVVGSPEYLLAPGGGIGGSIAKRIATAAAVNAGIGSASDAAAQAMDMAEGQKKDFDVTQNLTQAAFGGAVGGAIHSTIEVAPFVKGLFGNRGVDTLPAVDPRSASITTSPTTGQSVTMSPDEQVQFKQLLRTGNVDDIKSFLATKQGPKPTWSDVNQLTQFRDSLPPEGTNFVGQDSLKQALESRLSDQQRQVVTDHVSALTDGWANKPPIEVVPDPSHITDPQIRAQAMAQDTPENPARGLHGSDGVTRIFSDRANTPELVNAATYHEGLGHFGLAEQFGDKLESTMTTLADRNVGQFGKDVSAKMAESPGMSKALAAEETMAEMSEAGPLKPVFKDAVVATLRGFGRKMGLDLAYSDGEIQHILAMAHDSVVNGNGRQVSINGFKGTKSVPGDAPNSKWLNMSAPADAAESKFMFTGQKATNFSPEHPTAFRASDSGVRNEISDEGAKINFPNSPYRVKTTLGEVLDHPKLYEEYPHLKDMPLTHTDLGPDMQGGYDEKAKRILISNRPMEDKLGTTLHEVQHAIQDHEFDLTDHGGTNRMSYEDYRDDPLEKEAYTTEGRAGMTPEERAAAPVKFMNRSQMAMSPDYVPKHIESLYDAYEKDYVPTFKSHAEQTRDALLLGFKPSQIKDLGTNPETSLRARRMQGSINTMQERLGPLYDKLNSGTHTPTDLDNIRQILVDQSYIMSKYQNTISEAARTLEIAKLGYTKNMIASFGELLKEHGGSLAPLGDDATLLKFMKQMQDMKASDNLTGAGVMMENLKKPNWEDYLTTLHQNFMLSGLSTHIKAPLDMMIGIGNELKDAPVQLLLSGGRTALRAVGMDIKPGVHPTEIAGRLMGILEAASDAHTYINTARTLIEGGVNPNGFGGKETARIPVVSKVTDLISAQDAFFRAFATNMHLRGIANAEAFQEALTNGTSTKWDDLMTAGASKAMGPTSKMLAQAQALADNLPKNTYKALAADPTTVPGQVARLQALQTTAKAKADETLLLNRNALTEPLDRWKQTDSESSGFRRAAAFVLNFLTPFIRVESNSLLTRVIRRSPLAFLDPVTVGQLKAGGRDADIAMSRIVMGTATFIAAGYAANKGVTTGNGPDNPAKRAEMEASGWRPNAVHESGQYNTGNKLAQSINPLDPHNQTYSMVADMMEAYKNGGGKGNVARGLGFGFLAGLKSMADSSWISDIAPSIDAVTSGDKDVSKWNRLAQQQASTLVPNALGQIARITDQNQPQVDNPAQAVQADIPGLRQQLPVRQTLYGDPVQGGASGFGQHTWLPQDNRLTGGNHVDETKDPAEQELARLGSTIPTALVTRVNKVISDSDDSPFDTSKFTKDQIRTDPDTGKNTVNLTTTQYQEYQHKVGRAIVESVRQEMGTREWQQMSDKERVAEVKDIQKDMKAAVKDQLYGTQ